MPRAAEVLDDVRGADIPPGAAFQPELSAAQVEASTGVCTTLAELRSQLLTMRRTLARAARAHELQLLPAGLPVDGGESPLASGDRFGWMGRAYRAALLGYECCACQVHVGVADRDAAVAVLDRIRLWLPTLLALSVNSPFHRGRDTGYGSWRVMEQFRLPGSALPPLFGSAAEHDRVVASLIECGVVVDERMTFWLARPSPQLPTVEIRAADAVSTVDEAVLQAGLARALVQHALAAEPPPQGCPEHVAAAAVWSAARHGLDGPAIHPGLARPVPATALLEEMLAWLRPALQDSGDLPTVRRLLDGLLARGSGAERQRQAHAEGGVAAVLRMLEHDVMSGADYPPRATK